MENPIEVFECPHCGCRVLEVEAMLPIRQKFLYAWDDSDDPESEDIVYEYCGFNKHEGDTLSSIREEQGNALEELFYCANCGMDWYTDWHRLRKEGAVRVIEHKDYKKWLEEEKLHTPEYD